MILNLWLQEVYAPQGIQEVKPEIIDLDPEELEQEEEQKRKKRRIELDARLIQSLQGGEKL